jgi:hypothetical protein
MGKLGILTAWLPMLMCGGAMAALPAHYLDNQRCLAVLNIAAAAFDTLEEPDADAIAVRKHIAIAYSLIAEAIAAESDLTAQQVDKGLDIFEEEQTHWIDAFGEANEEPARGAAVSAVMKKAEHCMKPHPK